MQLLSDFNVPLSVKNRHPMHDTFIIFRPTQIETITEVMDLVFSDLKEVISYADCWSIGREAILHLFFNCHLTPEHMLYAVGNQHLRPPPLNLKLLCNF